MNTQKKERLFRRRRSRVRRRLRESAVNRVRLSVHRSNRHIGAQIIDDKSGRTLAAASSLQGELGLNHGGDCHAATKVGELIAKRAVEAGVKDCYLDRGGNLYHGRVKALAEAARAGGLNF
ncbi:MAG: 50S ribosomal protein L18 [Rhodobacteraceae bacterium]|nr:50S ribosomal protein L18 [Paracoccaceae bacterium]MCY4195739.1 50S ribosomal protein L18 [Paracoccaceae bacterium]